MGRLYRPDLPPGALADLVQELHALHARAGRPSTRDLANGQLFSYTAVHDLFTKTTTESPRLPVLLAVVGQLATLAPGGDVEEILDRFDALWQAADTEPFDDMATAAEPTTKNSGGDEPATDVAAAERERVQLTADEKRVLEPERCDEASLGTRSGARAMTKELFFLARSAGPLHDAAAELRRAGYLVRGQPRDLDESWSLTAYSAASELTDDNLATLDGIADRCGVDFDGWGTYVGPPELDDGPGKPSSRATLSNKPFIGTRSNYSGEPIVERQLTGHTDSVKAVAVTDLGGRPVVVSSDYRTVRVWDLTTGQPVERPRIRRFGRGHADSVEAMAVTQLNGRPVVIRCGFDEVRVWDLATNRLVGSSFNPPTGRRVDALAVAQMDGHPVVVAGGSNGAVWVWDLATDALVGSPFTPHTGSVRTLAVAQLGGSPVVVSGSNDTTLRVFGLAKGGSISPPLIGHVKPVIAVAIAQLDGRPVVVSGSADATVRVWDLATGQPSGSPFTAPAQGVPAVAVAQLNGCPVVVSSGFNSEVQVWDLVTRRLVGSPLTGHTGVVFSVATAELGGRPVVVSGGSDNTVRVWDLAARVSS